MTHGLFSIFVDRVEGKFAICEMPDESICDIEIEAFPQKPRDRERYIASLNSKGNIEIIRKADPVTIQKSKLSAKLIRF